MAKDTMKVTISFLCMLALVDTSVTTAFAPLPSVFSLQSIGIVGGKQSARGVLHVASASSSDVKSEVAVSAELEPTTKNDLLVKLVSWKVVSFPETQMVASVFLGCVATFALNNLLSVGPIKSSSIVGMISTMLLPEKLALGAFCGSFAGMAREAVIPDIKASAVLGLVSAFAMVLFDRKKWLIGVGGRLGFIAQLGCTSQFLISSLFFAQHAAAKLVGPYPHITPNLLLQLLPTCIYTVVGALLMSAWKEALASQSKRAGYSDVATGTLKRLSTSVAAVSVTGLVMSLFPVSVAGPAFCGSFIAMSSPEKIETYGGLIGASLVGGVSQIFLAGVLLGGWGGKLGTCSLLGVLLYKKMMLFMAAYSKALKGRTPKPDTAKRL